MPPERPEATPAAADGATRREPRCPTPLACRAARQRVLRCSGAGRVRAVHPQPQCRRAWQDPLASGNFRHRRKWCLSKGLPLHQLPSRTRIPGVPRRGVRLRPPGIGLDDAPASRIRSRGALSPAPESAIPSPVPGKGGGRSVGEACRHPRDVCRGAVGAVGAGGGEFNLSRYGRGGEPERAGEGAEPRTPYGLANPSG
jgi:hypothetical protein